MTSKLIRSMFKALFPFHVSHSRNTEIAVISVKLPARGETKSLLMHVYSVMEEEQVTFLGKHVHETTRIVVCDPKVKDDLLDLKFDHWVSFKRCTDIAIETLEGDYAWYLANY